jgi:hypothetical protein
MTVTGFGGYPQKQRFTYDVIPKENEKGIHPPIYLFIKINESLTLACFMRAATKKFSRLSGFS